jgi:hydroxymethylpyrimidine/phosphomethylpyrimidine kinase
MSRKPAPTERPVALTVAGSDSGGGAGIQADLTTMAARGVHPTSAVTAATAQHTRGVESTHVLPTAEVAAQIDAVREDFAVAAAKTGMLATEAVVELATEQLGDAPFPLVVDPVMVAASGDRLLDPAAEAAYGDLVGAATLATPNVDEAEVLTGRAIDDDADARAAAREVVELGADAALITGGHLDGDRVRDVLVTPDTERTVEHERIADAATHGSGCTLSAGIAARLADGDDLERAVVDELDAMTRAVRYATDVGEGPGAVQGTAPLRTEAARQGTVEAVRGVVDRLVAADAGDLIAEVGTNVAGAVPYAEGPDEIAAVDGRLSRTLDGVAPTGAVRFGASDHLARFLLAAREHHPELRFAINLRHDDATREALSTLDWDTVAYDRADQPTDVRSEEGSTMAWAARESLADRAAPPTAVADPGAVGKEPMCKLLATDAERLADRTLELLAARP